MHKSLRATKFYPLLYSPREIQIGLRNFTILMYSEQIQIVINPAADGFWETSKITKSSLSLEYWIFVYYEHTGFRNAWLTLYDVKIVQNIFSHQSGTNKHEEMYSSYLHDEIPLNKTFGGSNSRLVLDGSWSWGQFKN